MRDHVNVVSVLVFVFDHVFMVQCLVSHGPLVAVGRPVDNIHECSVGFPPHVSHSPTLSSLFPLALEIQAEGKGYVLEGGGGGWVAGWVGGESCTMGENPLFTWA